MKIFLLIVGIVLLFFIFFSVAIMLGMLMGRRTRRRCACEEARRVGRLIEERKKAAKQAESYSPKTVDPDNLPLLDPEMIRLTSKTS